MTKDHWLEWNLGLIRCLCRVLKNRLGPYARVRGLLLPAASLGT